MNKANVAASDQTAPAPRLVSLRAAADQLSISERHIRGLALAGRISIVRIGRCVRVPAAEVDRLAREGAPPIIPSGEGS